MWTIPVAFVDASEPQGFSDGSLNLTHSNLYKQEQQDNCLDREMSSGTKILHLHWFYFSILWCPVFPFHFNFLDDRVSCAC